MIYFRKDFQISPPYIFAVIVAKQIFLLSPLAGIIK